MGWITPSRTLIWLAGLALVAVGIVCLILSGAVVGPGWWQGTLQAFGVGFTVGGVVDVVAISLMNQVLGSESQQHRDLDWQAFRLLSNLYDLADEYEYPPAESNVVKETKQFLHDHGGTIAPPLRDQLGRALQEVRDSNYKMEPLAGNRE